MRVKFFFMERSAEESGLIQMLDIDSILNLKKLAIQEKMEVKTKINSLSGAFESGSRPQDSVDEENQAI
jgi:hypothetical protein